MRERGISESDVRKVLENPIEVLDVKFGRRAAVAKIRTSYLVVIFESERDKLEVATVFYTDKNRLRRLGFSRV